MSKAEEIDSQVLHTPEEIRNFLNTEVKKWKAIKSNPTSQLGDVAKHYIEAFQTIQTYLFRK